MAGDQMTISVSSPKYKTEKRASTIEGERNLKSNWKLYILNFRQSIFCQNCVEIKNVPHD